MKGVEILDTMMPGWWEKVDVDILDMTDPEKCVLGQLYGHYDRALKILGLTHEVSSALGFNDAASGHSLEVSWIQNIFSRKHRF